MFNAFLRFFQHDDKNTHFVIATTIPSTEMPFVFNGELSISCNVLICSYFISYLRRLFVRNFFITNMYSVHACTRFTVFKVTESNMSKSETEKWTDNLSNWRNKWFSCIARTTRGKEMLHALVIFLEIVFSLSLSLCFCSCIYFAKLSILIIS